METKQIHRESVENLLLDPENPRLPPEFQGQSPKKLLEYFARYEAVEDLMAAIGRNDFFPGEPLVVYRNDSDAKGKYRVIEGNRRLASVMLLSTPDAYKARPTLREIAESSSFKPNELPVVRVEKRDDALPYLGSRHIVGVKSWEPLQKARYMHQLFQTTKTSRSTPDRYRDVALRIGSGNRRDYIKKNLDALAIYNVIHDNNYFGDKNTSDLTFSFGVLYTALDYNPISGFLGVLKYDPEKDSVAKENDPIVNPNCLEKKHIKDFYRWSFYKDEDGRTVLGESRNLPKLSAILRSAEATDFLRKSLSLDQAYEHSEGLLVELQSALNGALRHLRYGNSIVANVSEPQGLDDIARQAVQQARQLYAALNSKQDSDEI